jgi:hypothetical protein
MIAQHRGLSCPIIVGLSGRLSTKQVGKEGEFRLRERRESDTRRNA